MPEGCDDVQGADQQPARPEKPQGQGHGQVVAPHSQGIVGCAVLDCFDHRGSCRGGRIRGGVDHEAQMVVIADGHGEIEEGEEEIHREDEQLDLVQALDSFAQEAEDLHAGLGRVIWGQDDIEQGQGDEDCRGGEKACGHGPVAQGLHGQDVPLVLDHLPDPGRPGSGVAGIDRCFRATIFYLITNESQPVLAAFAALAAYAGPHRPAFQSCRQAGNGD